MPIKCWMVAWAALAGVTLGCAGGQEVCRRDAITGNEQCQQVSRSPEQAAANAGAATALWGIAGCTINNCQPPYHCNTKTKQCEAAHCTQDSDCFGFSCDPEHGVCR